MAKNEILVYLAGPIDAVDEETRHQWRKEAKDQLLQENGVAVYDPAAAFKVTDGCTIRGTGPKITRINRHAVCDCDVLIAWVPNGLPSFGTVREIELARHRGIRVIVVGELVSYESHDLEVTKHLSVAVRLTVSGRSLASLVPQDGDRRCIPIDPGE